MLKLTRGAISFLLAQYRAIYKHAYVKGLASAIAVSAFVIPAAAHADDSADLTVEASKTVGVNGTKVYGTVTLNDKSVLNIAGDSGEVKVTATKIVGQSANKTAGEANDKTDAADAKFINISTGDASNNSTLTVSGEGLNEFAGFHSFINVNKNGTLAIKQGEDNDDLNLKGRLSIEGGTLTAKSVTLDDDNASLNIGKEATITTTTANDITLKKGLISKKNNQSIKEVSGGEVWSDDGVSTTIETLKGGKLYANAKAEGKIQGSYNATDIAVEANKTLTIENTTVTTAAAASVAKDGTLEIARTGNLNLGVSGEQTLTNSGLTNVLGTLQGKVSNAGTLNVDKEGKLVGELTVTDGNATFGEANSDLTLAKDGVKSVTISGGALNNNVKVAGDTTLTIKGGSVGDVTTLVAKTGDSANGALTINTSSGAAASIKSITGVGDLTITSGTGNDVTVAGDVNLGENAFVSTGTGKTSIGGTLRAKSVTVSAGDADFDAIVTKGEVKTTSSANTTFAKGINTEGAVTLAGTKATVKAGGVETKGAVTLSSGDTQITGDVKGSDVTASGTKTAITGNVESTGTTVTLANTKVTGNVSAKTKATLNGKSSAASVSGATIELGAAQADTIDVGALTATSKEEGAITLTIKNGTVNVNGATTAQKIAVENGTVNFKNTVTGDVTVTAGTLTFDKGVTGGLDASAGGDITLKGGVSGALKTAASKTLTLNGNFEQFGGKDVKGNVTIDGGATYGVGTKDTLGDLTVGSNNNYTVTNGTLNAKSVTVNDGKLTFGEKGVLTGKTIASVGASGTLEDSAGGLTVTTTAGNVIAHKGMTITTVNGGTVIADGSTVNVDKIDSSTDVYLGDSNKIGTVKVTDSLTASTNKVTVNAGTTLDVTDLIDSSKLVTVDTEKKTITKKADNLTDINVEGKIADIAKDKITGTGTLKVADLSGNSITTDVSNKLKALFETDSKLFLDIGNVTTTATATNANDTSVTVGGQYSNVVLQKAIGAAPDLVVNEAKVDVGTELKVKSEGGNFVSASDGSAAKVTLVGRNSEFTTVGSGTIGDVKATNNTQGSFNVQPGNVTAGDVTANMVNVNGNLTAKAVDSVTTSLGENAKLSAESLKAKDALNLANGAAVQTTGDVASETATTLGEGSSITGKSVTVKTSAFAENAKLAATGGDLTITSVGVIDASGKSGVTLMASDAVKVNVGETAQAVTLGDNATIIGNKGVTVNGDLTLGENANVLANGDTGLALDTHNLTVKSGSTIAASKIANSGNATFTVDETDRAVSSLTAEKLDLQSTGAVTLNNVNTKIGSQGAVVKGALTAEKGSFESAGAVEVTGALNAKVDTFKAKYLYAGAAATFTNAQVTLDDDSFVTGALAVNGGSLAAAKKLTLTAGAALTNGADVKVGTADLAAGKKITVGEAEGKNATFYATNLVGGADSQLIIDPAFTEKASVGAAHGGAGDGNQLSTLTAVGQNAGFAWGVGSVSEAINALTQAGYMSNGKFSESGVGTAAYLARTLDLAHGSLKLANQAAAPTPGAAGTLSLGNKTALLLTTNVIGDAAKAGTAVITNATATVEPGSEIAVTGEIDGSVMGANVALATDASGNVQDFTKSTFVDKTNSNLFDLSFDGKRFNGTYDKLIDFNLSKASTPVANYLKAALPTIRKGAGVGANYILANNLIDQGESLNGIARLGAFSGAISVAQMAADQTTQATATRLGTSHSQALIDGDKNQGFAVWANPFYRANNSSSLDAQGTEYGVDANLAGISIGADATFNNTRVGAVVTLGSASVDPKDAASQVDNDANTFGAGLYAGTTLFGDFTLTGDLSYTRVQNDITLKTPTFGFDKLTADGDSSVWTLGVTGAYNIDLGNGLKLAPHAGLRYSSYDLDSLAVNSMQGVVANNSYEKLNVFSIPVGVNLTKTFKVGDWALNTVGDLGLTFNAGDKDLESTTTFTGVAGSCKTESEVFDSVVFNGNVGLDANLGNLNIGAATGFKVGSNNKEFGINADARYSF